MKLRLHIISEALGATEQCRSFKLLQLFIDKYILNSKSDTAALTSRIKSIANDNNTIVTL